MGIDIICILTDIAFDSGKSKKEHRMKDQNLSPLPIVKLERSFVRFTLGQRWEHSLLIITGLVLLLTGLPQKYRDTLWSQEILSSPDRLVTIRQIHHVAAIILTIEVIYHLGRAIYLISKRRLNGDMLVTLDDGRDFWQMVKYLLFASNQRPKYGKYNFEQKITYWFIFFGIGILVVSGFFIWFPLVFTRFLPGGVVPAAKLAHSTEAIVAAIFVIIWHFYHVHFERLNLSIFTGKISEDEMRTYHTAEYERMVEEEKIITPSGESQS